MIYTFICDECGLSQDVERPNFKPPEPPICEGPTLFSEPHERVEMRRVYNSNIDTSGCKDHSFIPPEKRVFDPHRKVSAVKAERLFNKRIQEKRKLHRDGGNRGQFRHSHSIPADLYHGKIKETGDKHYWDDQKNLNRHSECRVDT